MKKNLKTEEITVFNKLLKENKGYLWRNMG